MRRTPAVLTALATHAGLRQTLGAYALLSLVEFANWVAIILYAYAEGGVSLAGLVSVVQLLPAALVAPALTSLLDRLPRGTALTVARACVAATSAATAAALLAGAPVPIVVLASALCTIALSAARPLHFAALPRMAEGPEALVSANALSSVGEGFAMFAGPILAGLGAQAAGAWLVFAGSTVVSALATVLCMRVDLGGASSRVELGQSSWRIALSGLAMLWRDWAALMLLLVLATRFVVGGALDVLGVAYSEQVLGMGASGAGLVIGAFGFGWLLGGGIAGSASLRRRLAPVIGISGVAQGCAFAAVALLVLIGPAMVALAIVGVASAVMMVSGRTLLQRSTDDEVLAQVFAVQEGIALIGWAVGAALARVLAEQWGPAEAFVPVGAGAALFTLAGFALMRRLDARAVLLPLETALLRRVGFLATVPPYELERMAHGARWITVTAGDAIIRQGEAGDRFYVVDSGEFAVFIDDQEIPRRLVSGDGFGEIALLRAVPRTATVTALSDGRLLAVGAADFLAAVTGGPIGRVVVAEGGEPVSPA